MGTREETEEGKPSSEATATGTDADEVPATTTTTEEAPPTEVGTKRPRMDEEAAEGREVRGRPSETETEARDGKEESDATTTKSGFGALSSSGGGFGSALTGTGFGGFGGLKSAGGGFGGFAAANANAGGGFASKAATPVFGGAATAPVALFGAGKKKEAEEEEDGDDDPEREVANDSIKPVVELEVVETKTGEEDETCTFRTEGALFEYVVDKEKGSRWVERGRGDVRLNQGENGYRLVMRAKGNFRLMLNASLFKGQKFQLMEGGKGVSFTCVNAASGDGAKMSMFALKMRAAASNAQSQAESFHAAASKAIEKLAKAEEK